MDNLKETVTAAWIKAVSMEEEWIKQYGKKFVLDTHIEDKLKITFFYGGTNSKDLVKEPFEQFALLLTPIGVPKVKYKENKTEVHVTVALYKAKDNAYDVAELCNYIEKTKLDHLYNLTKELTNKLSEKVWFELSERQFKFNEEIYVALGVLHFDRLSDTTIHNSANEIIDYLYGEGALIAVDNKDLCRDSELPVCSHMLKLEEVEMEDLDDSGCNNFFVMFKRELMSEVIKRALINTGYKIY